MTMDGMVVGWRVRTRGHRTRGHNGSRPRKTRRSRAAFYPLRRVGRPEDVAAAAVYFASDEAAWVSGAMLLVSGGAVMTSDLYRYLMRVNQGGGA